MSSRITIGGYQPAKSVHTRAMKVFAETVSRQSDGALTVEFRENIPQEGRNAADLFDLVESGALDGCYFSSSYLTHRVPELLLLDQHFVVPGRTQAYALVDGPFGAALADMVAAKTGYIVLGYWDNGLRHISTASDPVLDPADCDGLSLRILPSEDHRRIFRALGFDPVFIDVVDLPDAVRSGRVTAQENPLTNIYNFGLHDTHRTVTLTGHLLGFALVLFNAETFASWSEDQQAIVRQAVDIATQAQRQFAQDDETSSADAMVKDGVSLVAITDVQRNTFATTVRDAVDATRTGIDPAMIEMFERHMDHSSGGPI